MTAATAISPSATVERTAAPVRVLVVDDHAAVRLGLQRLLDAEPDLTVEAVAGDARQALEAARSRPIDVAIVDYHLGAQDGLSVTRSLRALPVPPRVLIYSAFADATLAAAATVAGADGLLGKGGLGDELCQAVRALARGRAVLPAVAAPLAGSLRSRLEPRDQAVMGMLLHGVPDAEVAETLGIAAGELERRRGTILRALTAERRGPAERSGPLDYERAARRRAQRLRARTAVP